MFLWGYWECLQSLIPKVLTCVLYAERKAGQVRLKNETIVKIYCVQISSFFPTLLVAHLLSLGKITSHKDSNSSVNKYLVPHTAIFICPNIFAFPKWGVLTSISWALTYGSLWNFPKWTSTHVTEFCTDGFKCLHSLTIAYLLY